MQKQGPWRPTFAASAERVAAAAVITFGINLLLQLGLHVLPPLAFACPFLVAFATGYRLELTTAEGVLLGVTMGAYMAVLCALLGGAYLVFINADQELPVLVIASLVVLHVMVLAGAGGVVGGHYVRRQPRRDEGGPL